MTSPTPQTVEVIQADRELAKFLGIYTGNDVVASMLSGRYDSTRAIQAIARHRIASRQPASGDVEAVCPICREAANEYFGTTIISPCPKCGSEKGDWCRQGDGTPLPAYHDVRYAAIAPVMGRDDVLEEAARVADELPTSTATHDLLASVRANHARAIAKAIRALKVQP